MNRGTVEWNNNVSPLTQPVREDKLSDFSLDIGKLSRYGTYGVNVR